MTENMVDITFSHHDGVW